VSRTGQASVARSLVSGQVESLRREVVVAIEPRSVGLEVAAQMYGISADMLVDLQDQHGFPLLRIGRRRLVPVAAADAWIAAEATRQAVGS